MSAQWYEVMWKLAQDPLAAKRMSEIPGVTFLALVVAKLETKTELTAEERTRLIADLTKIVRGMNADEALHTKRRPGEKRSTIWTRWLARRTKAVHVAYFLWLLESNCATEAKALAAKKAKISERHFDDWIRAHRKEAAALLPLIRAQCKSGKLMPDAAFVIP